jgi:hypothetical protein
MSEFFYFNYENLSKNEYFFGERQVENKTCVFCLCEREREKERKREREKERKREMIFHLKCLQHHGIRMNGRESAINKVLDGSTYPG